MRRSLAALAAFLLLVGAAGCGARRTALNDAIAVGDAVRVRNVLDTGASPNETAACNPDDQYSSPPLICAIEAGKYDVARLLVDRGADIGKVDWIGSTPLMAAAGGNDIDLVRLLIDKGAGVNTAAVGLLEGRTPLMSAAENGKIDVVRLLLDRGAAVNAQSRHGWTPLTSAVVKEHSSIARLLILRGANVDHALSKFDGEVAGTKNSKTRKEAVAAAKLLRDLRENVKACGLAVRRDAAAEAAFPDVVSKYRATSVNPDLPEEARVFRVQAEDAVARKRFQDAVELYGKALKISPWWPEGHFNQALILGESECPEEAIAAMERYLALVPDAPDARAARDKIYLWKGRLP